MLLSLDVGTVARCVLEEALHKALDDGTFTEHSGEVKIEASFQAGELTYSYEALSPRGALFLGELASVGFFGVEAQQLLT